MTDANLVLQAQTAASVSLRANLVCRVLFAILGTLLCWVPFRLLLRNGEQFAAVVFVGSVVVANLFTVVNALLWHHDDWARWWDGRGWCDLQVWLAGPLQTVYAAAIFAVMRHLARQVQVKHSMRVAAGERRRRRLVQALIIFPWPLVQLAFTWFDLAQRYIVGTLVGCSATYDNSWPKIFVYTAPPMLFALGSVPYAYLIWKRYRAISIVTAAALSSNSSAASRANRTRRRLYQMCLSILVPYVPLMLAFFVYNIKDTGAFKPYDYYRIHHAQDPYPWDSVVLVPSWMIPFPALNQPWIPIFTTVPIVLFFGMTKDALDTYRQYALALGMGKCWPALRDKGGLSSSAGRRNAGGSSSSNNEDSRTSYLKPAKAETPPLETAARKSISTRDFAMPDIPAIIVRPPTNLPNNNNDDDDNKHHETIISAGSGGGGGGGQPSVPSPPLSIAHPPAIPPRRSSLHRGTTFRKMLQQTAPLRDRLSSIGSMQTFGKGQGNKTGDPGAEGREVSREGRAAAAAAAAVAPPSSAFSFSSSSSSRNDDDRPPFITNANTGSSNSRRSMSKASSSRGKTSRLGTTSMSTSSGGGDSGDDEAAVPMLPLHNIQSAAAASEPRTPKAAMPYSGLHVPRSEPRSEDGLPVTPR